jgi:protein phosphatase
MGSNNEGPANNKPGSFATLGEIAALKKYNPAAQEIKRKIEQIGHGEYMSSPDERHPGVNEDAFLCDDKRQLYGVFDGMGGHPDGDKASRAARDYIRTHDDIPKEINPKEAAEKMKVLLEGANKAVMGLNKPSYGNEQPGTTAAVVKLVSWEGANYVIVGNIGDSRVYAEKNDGTLLQITQDDNGHDRATTERLSKAKSETELNTNDLRAFNGRFGISNHLGTNLVDLRGRVVFSKIEDTGRFVITSDGIHDNLTNDEILDTLKLHKGGEADSALVGQASRRSKEGHFRSKKDDMTTVVIDLNIPEAKEVKTSAEIKTPRKAHKINYAQFEETPAAPIIVAPKVEVAPAVPPTHAEAKAAAIAKLKEVIANAQKIIERNEKEKKLLLLELAQITASPTEKKKRSEFMTLAKDYAKVLDEMEKSVKGAGRGKRRFLVQKILDANIPLFTKMYQYSDLPEYAVVAKQINDRMQAINKKMGPAEAIPKATPEEIAASWKGLEMELEERRLAEIAKMPEIIDLRKQIGEMMKSKNKDDRDFAERALREISKTPLSFMRIQEEEQSKSKSKRTQKEAEISRGIIEKIKAINTIYNKELADLKKQQ